MSAGSRACASSFALAINRQLQAARAAASSGALPAARQIIADASEQLRRRGRPSQYLFEWQAQLEVALGEHARAESLLLAGRMLAEHAGHQPGIFRMDLLRAHHATRQQDHARSEQLLAGLRGNGCSLGPPCPERSSEICRWLRDLSFHDRRGQSMAALRVETSLVIAESWAARGRYVSAARLVAAFRLELSHLETTAASTLDVQQVRLREIEWLLAAGRLDEASDRLALVASPGQPVARIRVGLVVTHLALARGRLGEALRVCDALVPPPGMPALYVGVVAAQIAVRVELNQLQRAQDLATAAIERLADNPRLRELHDLLARSRSAAAARARSAAARWELPFDTPETPVRRGEDAGPTSYPWLPLPDDGSSFSVAWTSAANLTVLALEAGDLERAAAHHATLEQITRGVESESVTAHVALCTAMVAYYRCGPTIALLDELAAIASRFDKIGCRIAAARATRFAAWAAARLDKPVAHLELSRRTSTTIDAVASELGAAERLQFLMNKWNARDQFAAALMRGLLGHGGRTPPSRRALCRTFRQIDVLTHWPLDDALGGSRARSLAGTSSDAVARWVESQLAARAGRRGRFELRSVFGLWRFPRRTLVLHYHMLDDRTYLFRIAFGHIDLRELPIGRLQLPAEVSHQLADSAALADLAARCALPEALRDFPGIRRIIIVPHDAIANVPFAALPIEGRPLCTRIAISQLDRLSRLRRAYRRRAGRFVAIGLNTYAGSGQSDLIEAEAEAAAVARLAVGPAQRLLGDDATIANVRTALVGARGAHVAAHGVFDERRPDQGGVLLIDRGALRTLCLRELQRLDLRALDLVTLATCRAAAHATLPGRERICVPTALLDAGVRGVIASLWPIDDRASTAIMSALYEQLRSAPPSVALARTQAAFGKLPARHWAGLVFYGNDWS